MTIEVIGTESVIKALEQFAPRHANNLIRATIHGAAGELKKDIQKRVPVRTGNLKKSIKAKRRRSPPGQPVSDVIADQGKKARNDGFYWRFIEHGTQTLPERPFMRPAKLAFEKKFDLIIQQQFVKKLTAAVRREMKKANK